MTNEEAIKELQWVRERGFVADIGILGTDRIVCAVNMAIEALEKQIPQKPKSYHTTIFGDDRLAYDCPNCKHCFTVMRPNCDDVPIRNQHCDICGQKIDWSEEE